MIGLSGEIPLVSHSDVTSPFPPSGNGGYASNRDVSYAIKPVWMDGLIGICFFSLSPILKRLSAYHFIFYEFYIKSCH